MTITDADLGFTEADVAELIEGGKIKVMAMVTERVGEGVAFMPFHFREAAANLLTLDTLDPDGKIPEYKFCAIKISAA